MGSGRVRGSLGSVSSAELGSPSVDSISADSSPMHRPSATEKVNEETGSISLEELVHDDDKESDKAKKCDDDVATTTGKDKRKDSG